MVSCVSSGVSPPSSLSCPSGGPACFPVVPLSCFSLCVDVVFFRFGPSPRRKFVTVVFLLAGGVSRYLLCTTSVSSGALDLLGGRFFHRRFEVGAHLVLVGVLSRHRICWLPFSLCFVSRGRVVPGLGVLCFVSRSVFPSCFS